MKDCIGQELSVGDFVVTYAPQYKRLMHGIVVSFTNKKVCIKLPKCYYVQDDNYLDCVVKKRWENYLSDATTYKSPEFVVKLSNVSSTHLQDIEQVLLPNNFEFDFGVRELDHLKHYEMSYVVEYKV